MSDCGTLQITDPGRTLQIVEPEPSLSITKSPSAISIEEQIITLELIKDSNTLNLLSTGPQGIQGPKGDKGDKGDAGTGGDSSFLFTQSSPASSWTVPHNMGRYPHIDYISNDGKAWIADVEHVDLNSSVLTFPAPTSGKAACS